MTTDDLSAPLGQDRPRKRLYRLPFTAPQVLAAMFALFLIAFAGFAIFNDNPLGGEPTIKVAYDPSALPGDKLEPKTSTPVQQAPAEKAPASPQQTVTIIDGSSGTRRDVMIG